MNQSIRKQKVGKIRKISKTRFYFKKLKRRHMSIFTYISLTGRQVKCLLTSYLQQ